MSLLKGITSTPIPEVQLPYVVRYRSNFKGLPLYKQCLATYPFYIPKRLNIEHTLPMNSFLASYRRGYSTRPRSRILRFGSAIATFTLTGGVVFMCFVLTEVWLSLFPPQSDSWPKEIRRHLLNARVGQTLQEQDLLLDHLGRAWIAVQKIPIHVLNPDAPNKILSVAIWFADILEKNGQAQKAYKVLTDAVALHESRFEKTSTSDSAQEWNLNDIKSAKLEEKRHLISVFTKIAWLSEKYDPKAEGKWLSHAIREMMTLLPICKAVPKEEYAAVISGIEGLSSVEASFSGLTHDLDLQYKISACSPDSIRARKETNFDHSIPVEEANPKGDILILPYWHAQDVASAIAIPLERLGIYAEKHGRYKLAADAYISAVQTIRGMTPIVPVGEAMVEDWKAIVQMLRIINRKVGLVLRHLESETHPTEWLYYLHVAWKDSIRAETLASRHVAIVQERTESEDWKPDLSSAVDPSNDALVQCAIMFKHKAICAENLGILQDALSHYEAALTCYKRTSNVKEMNNIEERIVALKRSIAENKTSIKSYMHPLALKEWEKLKKAKSQVPKEGLTGSGLQA